MKFKTCLQVVAVLFLLIAIISCSRNNDIPDTLPKAGKIGFFNVATGLDGINLYLNGTRQNSNKISFGEYSGYLSVLSGQQSVLFKGDSLRNEVLPATTYTIASDSTTIFVSGKPGALALIATKDTAKADTGTKNYKPKLRFVNTSYDSPALDVLVNSVSITNQAYKGISAFTKVDTGTVTLTLNTAGTTTKLLSSKITLQANSVYTLFIYGSFKTNAEAFGLLINR